MTTNQIQNAFIWTKVQSDAGQPIDWILNRKELERQSGNTFWWGIGESKADQIKLLLTKDPRPLVLFSLMLSRPHRRDSHPDGVLLWEAYKTTGGEIPLPPHAIVLSRAHDSKGRPKQVYYALVCENPTGILHSGHGMLDTRTLRNFGDSGKPVGSSQVTAVVERTRPHDKGRSYPITARATLTAPYAVQLTGQRKLSEQALRLLHQACLGTMSPRDWIAVAKQIRRMTGTQARSSNNHEWRTIMPSSPNSFGPM
jgi:hypothetical protein